MYYVYNNTKTYVFPEQKGPGFELGGILIAAINSWKIKARLLDIVQTLNLISNFLYLIQMEQMLQSFSALHSPGPMTQQQPPNQIININTNISFILHLFLFSLLSIVILLFDINAIDCILHSKVELHVGIWIWEVTIQILCCVPKMGTSISQGWDTL